MTSTEIFLSWLRHRALCARNNFPCYYSCYKEYYDECEWYNKGDAK